MLYQRLEINILCFEAGKLVIITEFPILCFFANHTEAEYTRVV